MGYYSVFIASSSSLNANSTFHNVYVDKNVTVTTTEKFYTGITVVIPANSYFSITVAGLYASAPCRWLGISAHSASDVNTCFRESESTFHNTALSLSSYADKETTLYIYGQWQWAGTNQVLITGYYVTQ